jgi:UDP-N-acetylmuramate: L-alanyl-gamma-D-glutamyl-meso-diaminopimelate ligase
MNIHILGIAGTMTAPLAVELKNQGHQVSGSDQEKIYPPISTLLKRAKIPLNQTAIDNRLDLIIVGSSYKSFKLTQQEYHQAKKLNLNLISATKFIAQNIGKKNTILVAGTYGKTTIASLLVWIFLKAKLNPSYMFGGVSLNHIPSLKITPSDWSIIEADESINGLDKKAKFLYYPLRYLIITSALWEHRESYLTLEKNQQAFARLIKRVPRNGIVVYNPHSPSLNSLIPKLKSPSLPYDLNHRFSSKLIGQYNQENIAAAYTLCRHLGLEEDLILSAIQTYRGVARRLQLIKKTSHNLFFDDFAQSPQRIASAIQTISQNYPDNRIRILFEPHANFLKTKQSINGLSDAFRLASEVVLAKIGYSANVPPSQRATPQDFTSTIGDKLVYLPLPEQIYNYYIKTLQPQEILIHFSSGGLQGINLFRKIISNYSR